jgi:hypothetical protein
MRMQRFFAEFRNPIFPCNGISMPIEILLAPSADGIGSQGPRRGVTVQKSNQKLDAFISEITSGEASPILGEGDAGEEAIWSGEIAEVSQQTYSFYLNGNAGPPRIIQDHWFIFSNDKLVTDPGILFWKHADQFFARRMDQEQWDKFIKSAKVNKKFW